MKMEPVVRYLKRNREASYLWDFIKLIDGFAVEFISGDRMGVQPKPEITFKNSEEYNDCQKAEYEAAKPKPASVADDDRDQQRCNHCMTISDAELTVCPKCGRDDALMFPLEAGEGVPAEQHTLANVPIGSIAVTNSGEWLVTGRDNNGNVYCGGCYHAGTLAVDSWYWPQCAVNRAIFAAMAPSCNGRYPISGDCKWVHGQHSCSMGVCPNLKGGEK